MKSKLINNVNNQKQLVMLTMRRTSKLSILLFAVCTFIFSAASFAQQTVEMEGTDDMKFDVEEITAAPGEEVTVKLTTKSKLPEKAMSHNFALLKDGVDARAFSMASAKHADNEYIDPDKEDDVLAATDMAAGGETVEVTFTAPEETGEYDYVCTFPGHYVSGMKGVLKVK